MNKNYFLNIRPITIQDAKIIYQWRNHPSIRSVSFSSQEIFFYDHKQWLKNSLQQSNRIFYMIELRIQPQDKIKPIGVIHFHLQKQEAEISLYIDPSKQKCGYGKLAVIQAIKKIKQEKNTIKKIIAKVLLKNKPSHQFFQNLHFQKDSVECKEFIQYYYLIENNPNEKYE